MNPKMRWKPGSRIKADVSVADKLVRENIEKYNGFNAEAFFRSQKANSAPLHDEFEWDKEKAWVAHNVTKANYIVRNIELVEQSASDPEREIVIRAFTSADAEEDDCRRVVYRDTVEMLKTPDGKALLLSRATSDIRIFKRKYAHLFEMATIVSAMDDFLDDVG